MRRPLWLCCVNALFAAAAQATSFTAIRAFKSARGNDHFRQNLPGQFLTPTAAQGSRDAEITVPDILFARVALDCAAEDE